MGTHEQLERQETIEAGTRRDFVVELLISEWEARTFNPLEDASATSRLVDVREEWRSSGDTAVLTSGAYDLLHLDHLTYLLDAKLQGAERHYSKDREKTGAPEWASLTEESQEAIMMEFLRAGKLKLIVSVDGNSKIAERKSGKAEKGNQTRPIMDWETRARLLQALSFQIEGGARHPIVDVVTINDPIAGAGTPHQDLFELADLLQPDVWAAYHESAYIFNEAPRDPRLSAIALRKITEADRFVDKLVGTFSTTKIAERLTS
jgi:hypothetical protein